MEGLLLVHVPPPTASDNKELVPAQNVVVPKIDVGFVIPVFTVSVIIA